MKLTERERSLGVTVDLWGICNCHHVELSGCSDSILGGASCCYVGIVCMPGTVLIAVDGHTAGTRAIRSHEEYLISVGSSIGSEGTVVIQGGQGGHARDVSTDHRIELVLKYCPGIQHLGQDSADIKLGVERPTADVQPMLVWVYLTRWNGIRNTKGVAILTSDAVILEVYVYLSDITGGGDTEGT